MRDADEIKRAIATFAGSANSGLIVTSSPLAVVHRDLIVRLAAQHKLPAVYYGREFTTGGGLISYGPDLVDQFRARPATSTASSRARNRLTSLCSHQPSTSW